MRSRSPSTLREAIRCLSTIKNSTSYDVDGEDTLWYNSDEYSNYTLSDTVFIENISLRDMIILKNPVLRAYLILHKLPYVELNNKKIGILWE